MFCESVECVFFIVSALTKRWGIMLLLGRIISILVRLRVSMLKLESDEIF